MKVDILIAVAEKGGVENVINMTVPYLQKKSWKVRIIQLVWEGYNWVEEGIPFFPLLEGREGHDLEEFARVYADFLQKNGEPQMVLATAWPYMCYVAKEAAFLIKKELLTVSWLHAPVEQYMKVGYGGYESLDLADVHFAISKSIYKEIIENCKNSWVVCVHNPIDRLKCIEKMRKKAYKNPKKKLFFIGRISKEKRLDVIIKALQNVKQEWNFYIIGEGENDYKDYLNGLAREYGVLDTIRWYGWKENPWIYAKDADAVVMASEYEGFPLTAIEALANGIPVISTPVSGIIELIQPGKNGFLYPFGDENALTEILKSLSEGILPEISSEVCIQSVKGYKKERALADFEFKLREIMLNRKCLKCAGNIEQCMYNEDKISIIVPCYNAEKYIRVCIESILKQTVPLDMLEIIFIDDDSTDKTCEIVKCYEEKYPESILLIECEKNAGPGAARNIGLQYASGNYIVFVDADDVISEGALERVYRIVHDEIPDVIWVGNAFVEYKKEDSQMIVLQECIPEYVVYGKENRSEAIIDIMSKLYYNSFFHYMRVDFLKENEINFFEPYYADCAGMTKVMVTAKRMTVLDFSVYELTMNTSQTAGKYTWDSYEFMFVKQWKIVREVFYKEQYVNIGVCYAAMRILRNLMGNIGTLCKRRCRDKYMNPLLKSTKEIVEQLEQILRNPYVLEMMILAGEKRSMEMLVKELKYLEGEDVKEIVENSWLKPLFKVVWDTKTSDYETLKILGDWILQKENIRCIGFGCFLELFEQTSNEVVNLLVEKVEKIIEKYSRYLTELEADNWLKENIR